MRVLLLGAPGFAGTHFAAAARDAGLSLVTASIEGEQADIACDILDPGSIASALAEAQPTAIVNMAGQASVSASWSQPRQTFEVNATAVLNLLDAIVAWGVDAYLLCVSSAEVYGTPHPGLMPLTEDVPVSPVSPYGASKAAMEVLADQYSRSHGVRVGVTRAFNQTGPGQPPQFVASSLTRQIAEAERSGAHHLKMVAGNVQAARDFIDVRDSARAYVEMVERDLTGTYNLCSGKALKIGELIEEMKSQTGLKIEVSVDDALVRPADPPLIVGSCARLRSATRWKPRIPIGQTVSDMLDWWRSHSNPTEDGISTARAK